MNKLRYIYPILGGVHLVLILLTSIYMTTISYCSFYDKPEPQNYVYRAIENVLNPPAVRTYSKFTGAETGYGFFAPNVMSSGNLTFRTNNSNTMIQLSNYENTIRYNNLVNVFLAKRFKEIEDKVPVTKGAESKIDKDSCFHDLMLKNMSVRFINSPSDTINIHLNIYEFPSLKEYRKGEYKEGSYFLTYRKQYYINNKI